MPNLVDLPKQRGGGRRVECSQGHILGADDLVVGAGHKERWLVGLCGLAQVARSKGHVAVDSFVGRSIHHGATTGRMSHRGYVVDIDMPCEGARSVCVRCGDQIQTLQQVIDRVGPIAVCGSTEHAKQIPAGMIRRHHNHSP